MKPSASRSILSLAALVLSAAALASPALATDTVAFADGTFGAGWTSFLMFDTSPGANSTFTSSTQPSGPTGDYRFTSHTWDGGAIGVGHINLAYTHTPATRPIQTLDFSCDLAHLTSPTIFGAVGYRPLIAQGGSYYAGPSFDVWFSWQPFAQNGIVAGNFARVAGTGPDYPDFSACGAQMYFGFLSSNSSNGGVVTKTSGLDNWAITLHLGTTTYSDGTFTPGNWTSTKILDTTAGSGATTSSITTAVGGSPGAYRQTTHTFGAGAIVVAHMSLLAGHDPSVEPIQAVDLDVMANHLTAGTVGGAVGLRVAVLQGGAYYGSPTINVFNGSWTPYTQIGVTANQFTLIAGSGPAYPNFTNSGGLLQFGYITSNSAGGGPVTKQIGIDGWTVRAQLTPPCSGTLGIPLCTGDDISNPCPCIATILPGGPGRGCPNSIAAAGAKLTASGTASLANDSLVLHGYDMPNGFCQFIQGTLITGTPFGDGRLCIGGTITRLAVRLNINESSQYPASIDPPISVQAPVGAPGQRMYQIWYRDSANFCTSATFNLSNALVVNWTP